jgi:hypothetical protein
MINASDSALIDYLESVHKASGLELCVMRESTTGRGWRLHSIPMHEAETLDVLPVCARTVREAIVKFMDAYTVGGERMAWLENPFAMLNGDEQFDRREEKYGDGV